MPSEVDKAARNRALVMVKLPARSTLLEVALEGRAKFIVGVEPIGDFPTVKEATEHNWIQVE